MLQDQVCSHRAFSQSYELDQWLKSAELDQWWTGQPDPSRTFEWSIQENQRGRRVGPKGCAWDSHRVTRKSNSGGPSPSKLRPARPRNKNRPSSTQPGPEILLGRLGRKFLEGLRCTGMGRRAGPPVGNRAQVVPLRPCHAVTILSRPTTHSRLHFFTHLLQ